MSESYDFSGVSARAAWCIEEGMPGNHFGNVTGFKFEVTPVQELPLFY